MLAAVPDGNRATLGIVRGETLQGGGERSEMFSGGEQPTLVGNQTKKKRMTFKSIRTFQSPSFIVQITRSGISSSRMP